MTAQIISFEATSAKQLCDLVNRHIRKFETSQVTVQVVSSVVVDPRTQSGSKPLYEAFVTYPASS